MAKQYEPFLINPPRELPRSFGMRRSRTFSNPRRYRRNAFDTSDTEAFDRKCPCQIFQVHPRKFYSSFPFDERDNKFKKALSQGIQNYGPERILNLKKANPPKRLLDLVSEYSKK